MTTKKSTLLSAANINRRGFTPIQMDLVERLTRQADTLSNNHPTAQPVQSGDLDKLAA